MLNALTDVVTPTFLIIAVGIVLGRVVGSDLAAINRLGLYGATPALIFHALSTSEIQGGVGRLLLGYGIFFIAMGSLAWLAAKRVAVPRRRGFIGLSLFVNSGNMMLPIALFALGPEGLERALTLFVVTLLIQVLVGPTLYAGEQTSIRWGVRVRPLVPVLAATVLGVAGNIWTGAVPFGIARGFAVLAGAAIPLALLTLGLQISRGGFAILRGAAWGAVALRLVIGPLVGYTAGRLVGASPIDVALLMLIAAMPPAVINYVFALEYGTNSDDVARTVAFATAASVVTLAAVVFIAARLVA